MVPDALLRDVAVVLVQRRCEALDRGADDLGR